VVTSADTKRLQWNLLDGSFLDLAFDKGLEAVVQPQGGVDISADAGNTYYLYVITEEGGVLTTVNTAMPKLSVMNRIYVLVEVGTSSVQYQVGVDNIGGSSFNWTASTTTQDLIKLETISGDCTSNNKVMFTVNVEGYAVGEYQGDIVIDAGDAGTETITVIVDVVEDVHDNFLPLVRSGS
jgi:hypothetical protein